MRILRMFFKIILFPITLVLTIFVAVSTFLVERVAGLLNIVAGIFLFGAIACLLQYFFGWPVGQAGPSGSLTAGICGIAFAFLLSPYGLPTASMWILAKLDTLNDAIKAI